MLLYRRVVSSSRAVDLGITPQNTWLNGHLFLDFHTHPCVQLSQLEAFNLQVLWSNKELTTVVPQPEPKVAHKLIPSIPLKTPFELIDLCEEFGVDRKLLTDLFHTTDDRCVVTSIKDPSNHRIGVIVQ